MRPDEQHLGGRICNYLEGSGRERISKQGGKERKGWIGHPLARREFDVSGLAVAPNTPRRAKSMDFIDFDVSERAPPGPGGLKA